MVYAVPQRGVVELRSFLFYFKPLYVSTKVCKPYKTILPGLEAKEPSSPLYYKMAAGWQCYSVGDEPHAFGYTP